MAMFRERIWKDENHLGDENTGDNNIKVDKGKGEVHPSTGTEALYRPYSL
jgi:hypothetical protein